MTNGGKVIVIVCASATLSSAVTYVMLKSAEIISLVAKDKVAHENFFANNTCKKANKLIM